jgi:hypothetical protein
MTASSYVADGVVERDLDRAYSDQSGTETISVAEYWYSVRQVSRGQCVYLWIRECPDADVSLAGTSEATRGVTN